VSVGVVRLRAEPDVIRQGAIAKGEDAGLVDRALAALATAVEAWRTRRQVRVTGFSLLAVLAFSVAFALASQDGCGPGCGAFGTGLSPLTTVASGDPGGAPATTAPRRVPPTTAAPAGRSAATGALAGASSGRPATTTSESRLTTTTRRPGSGGGVPGSTSPTTRPPTTPTTAPPTTPTTPTTPPTTTVVPLGP
jgi:hypothetical protein